MFLVPVEKHEQNAHLRPKGKIAELTLGYGSSVGNIRLIEEELQPLVNSWKAANPNIVPF